jgi:uncharacterized Zn finger protein
MTMPRQTKKIEQELLPISDSLLKKLAGSAAFIKGKDYCQLGAVIELDVKGNKIVAEVRGTEIYQVTLIHNSQSLSGACDCPASKGVDFCKHCVAVALTRAADIAAEQESKNQPVKKMSEPEKRRVALREYFLEFNKEKLIEQLVEIIDADKSLRQDWQLKAQQSRPLSSAELRKLVNASIPLNKHLYRSADVRHYFVTIEKIVSFLTEKLDTADKDSLAILEFTFERIMHALETVDDSVGYRFDMQEQLTKLYMQALEKQQLPPQALAEYIFNLWEKPYYDFLPTVPDDFECLLNPQAKEFFLDLVKAAWENYQLPKRDKFGFGNYDYRQSVLQSVLLNEAYAQKNIADVIHIKSKFANGAKDYLNIADACLELKQIILAREWLEKARREKDKKSLQTSAFERTEVNILLQEKNPQAAIDVLWLHYQRIPNIDCFNAIMDIAKQVKPLKNWLEEAVQFHRTQLNKPMKDYEKLVHVNLLVSFLLQQKKSEGALAICQQHETEGRLLLKVAACYKNEPDKSVPLVKRLINVILQQANLDNRNYKQVVELLKRIQTYANNGNKPELFTKLLTEIRGNYKVKRNLMAYMQEAFGG